ncbi:MAG: hypothetical protein D6707_04695 [Bacteroidetes bacterium]|nr:MAG: hypothetical protein D6707_04695 [Bacteroidota bacterium]
MKSILKNGSISGLVMGISLFIGGAILARLVYGPQMAPEGKFEASQMNPFYFIWTKLVIGLIFGIIFTFVYEKLPLVKKISGVFQGVKYSFFFWLIISLWNISHPVVYESFDFQNETFWLLYTLCGFICFGGTLGFLYKRQAN